MKVEDIGRISDEVLRVVISLDSSLCSLRKINETDMLPPQASDTRTKNASAPTSTQSQQQDVNSTQDISQIKSTTDTASTFWYLNTGTNVSDYILSEKKNTPYNRNNLGICWTHLAIIRQLRDCCGSAEFVEALPIFRGLLLDVQASNEKNIHQLNSWVTKQLSRLDDVGTLFSRFSSFSSNLTSHEFKTHSRASYCLLTLLEMLAYTKMTVAHFQTYSGFVSICVDLFFSLNVYPYIFE